MEIFKDIEGYEGSYQVSNEGRVKSLKYRKEHILKPSNSRGYLRVALCKNNKRNDYSIHRLVASAFIDNPEGLNEVNHIDEDKTNNYVENLEWCSHAFNINHGTRTIRAAEKHRGKTNPRAAEKLSIPVDMLTKSGELIRTFQSAHEAERFLKNNGYPKASCCNINSCCKGKLQSCYSFKWRYSQGN